MTVSPTARSVPDLLRELGLVEECGVQLAECGLVRPSFCIFQDPIVSHKCMSKMAVKTSKDTHKSAAELGTP